MSNTIPIVFDGETSITLEDHLWQYDTEQILHFSDLELPETYEVHFSTHGSSGTATTVVATSDDVEIPDKVLANGHSVFAWVYVDGMTTHRIIIPVWKRARPEDPEITSEESTTISTLISQMQSVLEQVQEYKETVESLVEQAQGIVEDAEGLTATVDSDGYINIG